MATYTRTASGGAALSGCSDVTHRICITVQFKEGDPAYVKNKAQKGELEKVVVKTVVLDSRKWVGTKLIDTMNRLWFEYELVSHADAITLAKAYYQRQADLILAEIDRLPC